MPARTKSNKKAKCKSDNKILSPLIGKLDLEMQWLDYRKKPPNQLPETKTTSQRLEIIVQRLNSLEVAYLIDLMEVNALKIYLLNSITRIVRLRCFQEVLKPHKRRI